MRFRFANDSLLYSLNKSNVEANDSRFPKPRTNEYPKIATLRDDSERTYVYNSYIRKEENNENFSSNYDPPPIAEVRGVQVSEAQPVMPSINPSYKDK